MMNPDSVAGGAMSIGLKKAAALLLLAAVGLWLFAGQGGLSHPVQLAARGCVIGALACVLLYGNLRSGYGQIILLTVILGWAAVGNLFSGCPYLAWQELLTWATAAAAVFAGQIAFDGFPARRWWLWLVLLLVLTAVPEFIRNLAGFGAAGLDINVIGLPGNSNVLGVMLAVCVPAVAAAIADARNRKFGLIVLPLLLAGLLLSYSRNAWLTAVLGLAAWWFLHWRGQRTKLLVLLTAFLLVLLAVPATRARLHAFIDPAHPSNVERVDLFRSVGKWLTAVEPPEAERFAGQNVNLWLGRGMGQWGFTYPRLATLDKWQLHTHNLISEWLVGGGLPLALLGIVLIISGFWGRISDAERPAEAVRRAQLLVLVVANQFDYLLWIPLTAFLFFAVLLRMRYAIGIFHSVLLLLAGGALLPGMFTDFGFAVAGFVVFFLSFAGLGFGVNLFLKISGLRGKFNLFRTVLLGGAASAIMVTVVLPLYLYHNYCRGLQFARMGNWTEAQKCFTNGLHPVYRYYWCLADWKITHAPLEGWGIYYHILPDDPYIYQQTAIFAGDLAEVQRLDPHQMIAGGEEFPTRVITPCLPPAQFLNWEQLPEGDILNCARNWSDSFPAEAERAFRLALQKDPRWPPTYVYFGEFLVKRQRWQDAIDALLPMRAVQGKRPEDAAAICETLAAAYAALGDAATAQQYRESAAAYREQMITRHAQVIRMMFHIPTLPREGFNDN